MVLTDAGYRVETASGGEAALDLLRHSPAPDLILLDLMMPDLDGWAFRAIQRRKDRLGAIPVVLVSAADELREAAAELAAADYLAKPFQVERLLEKIASHLRSADARST